ENIAYNAFLTGKVLLGMRVADVQKALAQLGKAKPARIVLAGRRDGALVATFAAALDKNIFGLAVRQMPHTLLPPLAADAKPINAASLVPALLRDFGDLADVLSAIAPRRILLADFPFAKGVEPPTKVAAIASSSFSAAPEDFLTSWLKGNSP